MSGTPIFELTVFITHIVATLFMTGLIWFVQLVHYPLMHMVDADRFGGFEKQHQRRITWIVGPAMLTEGATAVAWLVIRPGDVLVWTSVGLLLIIWLSTALQQVPEHRRLEDRFDGDAHRRLVRTNWVRTIAWSLRSVIVCWMLAGMIT